MRQCKKWPIGICSWSLKTGVEEIGLVMTALGLEHMNLAIAPALAPDGEAYLDAVRRQGWTITAGMMNYTYEDYSTLDTIRRTGGIAPDEHWPASGEAFGKAAKITAELGSPYIMMHVGFLDHTDTAYAKKFYDRVRYLGDRAGEAGVSLLMETGQETAEDLQRFVETLNHPNVLLNFDPANLILYDKDEPIGAFRRLAPWVRHIHIKDGIRTTTPGTWGRKTFWGDGEVNAFAFLKALEDEGYDGALAIEYEANSLQERVAAITTAVRRLEAY